MRQPRNLCVLNASHCSRAKQTFQQGDLESAHIDITRSLIKTLPQLFAKYQTDESRMIEIIQLPQLMKLELYLEMRMLNVSATNMKETS